MEYRLKKANIERLADTEEAKNNLEKLGYKVMMELKKQDNGNGETAEEKPKKQKKDTKEE